MAEVKVSLKANPEALATITAIQGHLSEVAKGLNYLSNLPLLLSETTPDPVPTSPVVSPITSTPVITRTGRKIPWGKQCMDLHPDFLEGVFWIEGQLGIKAENLVSCMKFESNLNPKARNPKSSASGLIQFMGATATNLGTSIEHIRSLGPMEQLSYVYKYFKQFGNDMSSWDIADTYMAILWPAGIGKPLSYKVFVDDARRSNDAYDVNKGLDKDKDGFVTKAEAADKVIKLYAEGLLPANVLTL